MSTEASGRFSIGSMQSPTKMRSSFSASIAAGRVIHRVRVKKLQWTQSIMGSVHKIESGLSTDLPAVDGPCSIVEAESCRVLVESGALQIELLKLLELVNHRCQH